MAETKIAAERVWMFKKIFPTELNAVANFAGSLWTALLSLIFVPVYLHYIGIESYGLIGIFNSIITFIVLLDLGLSPTLNRELARLSIAKDSSQEMHDLKSTLERLNWIIAILMVVVFSALAPLIARYWINPKDLPIDVVTQALLIMGANIAIQFSINFYVGGLMGLQKQLILNAISVVCSTLRFGGAFLVLTFYSPTIKAFLIWQGATLLLQAVLMAVSLRLSLPDAKKRGRFQKGLLLKIKRFAAGMTGITVVSLVLTQTDKIILSKILNLETFGYYMLAVSVASMSIGVIINSLSQAVYPQFSKFVAGHDEVGLGAFYHRCCQIASVFLFPFIAVIALYSYQILLIWTRSEQIATNTHNLLTIVVLGTGLNALMWLPYFLQLAHGWTKLSFYVNLTAVAFLIPMVIYGTYHYGAIGGALGWLALNAGYVLITPHLMHGRILKNEKRTWYLNDILLPFTGAFAAALTGKLFLSADGSRIEIIAVITLVLFTAFIIAALLTRETRGYLNLGWQKLLSQQTHR